MTHRKREKQARGIRPLSTYMKVCQPKMVDKSDVLVLKGLQEGKTQSQLAKELGTSRQAISKRVKKLRTLILVDPSRLTTHAGSTNLPPYDVRFRSLRWQLTEHIQLPFDGKAVDMAHGVKLFTWSIKGNLIRYYKGLHTFSLEIECGRATGNSRDDCFRKHDEEALNLFRYVAQKYPQLSQATHEHDYTINRTGEFCVNELNNLAEVLLDKQGGGTVRIGDIIKFDKSRGYPEAQFLKDVAFKSDLAPIAAELAETKQAILALGERQVEMTTTMKELVKILTPKKPEPPPEPIKEQDTSHEGMFR